VTHGQDATVARMNESVSQQGVEKVREHLHREVRAAKLTPREVIKWLSNQLVAKMATSKGSPGKKGTSR